MVFYLYIIKLVLCVNYVIYITLSPISQSSSTPKSAAAFSVARIIPSDFPPHNFAGLRFTSTTTFLLIKSSGAYSLVFFKNRCDFNFY